MKKLFWKDFIFTLNYFVLNILIKDFLNTFLLLKDLPHYQWKLMVHRLKQIQHFIPLIFFRPIIHFRVNA